MWPSPFLFILHIAMPWQLLGLDHQNLAFGSMFPGYDDMPWGLITKEAVTALKRSSFGEFSGERSLACRSTWKEIPGAKYFGPEILFSCLWAKHRREAKRKVTSVLTPLHWRSLCVEIRFLSEIGFARISSKKVWSCHQRFISIQNVSVSENCVNLGCYAPLSSVLLCTGRTVHPPLRRDNSLSAHCSDVERKTRESGIV